jgi:hypothetical protein
LTWIETTFSTIFNTIFRGQYSIFYAIFALIFLSLPLLYYVVIRLDILNITFTFPETIKLRYLFFAHILLSLLILVPINIQGPPFDLSTYFFLANIPQDASLLLRFLTGSAGTPFAIRIEPFPYVFLLSIIWLGFPMYLLFLIPIIFSAINLLLVFKLLENISDEIMGFWGAILYMFSPVILRIEADLIRNLMGITFGLLIFYSWRKQKLLTPLFMILLMGTHLITAIPFFIAFIVLIFKEKDLLGFIFIGIVISIGILVSLPFILYILFYYTIIHPYFLPSQTLPNYIVSVLYELYRIVAFVGILGVYFLFNHKKRDLHWDSYLVFCLIMVFAGFAFLSLHASRWGWLMVVPLVFLVSRNLNPTDNDRDRLFLFQIISYCLFACLLLIRTFL